MCVARKNRHRIHSERDLDLFSNILISVILFILPMKEPEVIGVFY